MIIDEYLTIESNSSFEFKEKGSKFFSLAFPIISEEELEKIIKSNKKKFYDATHNCFAYRLGIDNNSFRYNDDGEPSGTAGKPILNAIDTFKLTDVLIIVNRYFGGTKLGTSGLIKAYNFSAEGVLQNSKIISKIITSIIKIEFDYQLIQQIMYLIAKFNLKILKQEFNEKTVFELQIRLSQIDSFKSMLTNSTGGKVNILF